MTRDDLRWKRIHVVSLAISRHIHRSGIQRSNVESVSSRAERFPSDGALGPSQKRLLIFPRRKRRRFVRKHLVSPSYGSLQIRSFPFFLPSPAALLPFLPSSLSLLCNNSNAVYVYTCVFVATCIRGNTPIKHKNGAQVHALNTCRHCAELEPYVGYLGRNCDLFRGTCHHVYQIKHSRHIVGMTLTFFFFVVVMVFLFLNSLNVNFAQVRLQE